MITPAQLSSFATAIGPLGVVNVIPAFFASTGNNVASGLATGVNHALLGASTEVAQAAKTRLAKNPTGRDEAIEAAYADLSVK